MMYSRWFLLSYLTPTAVNPNPSLIIVSSVYEELKYKMLLSSGAYKNVTVYNSNFNIYKEYLPHEKARVTCGY